MAAQVDGEYAVNRRHEGAAVRDERELWEVECVDWTDEEIVRALTSRYGPVTPPPCRVCGGTLSPQSIGSGPTVWGCDVRPYDPDHYSRSRWDDHRRGGDDVVIEAVRRWNAAREKNRP